MTRYRLRFLLQELDLTGPEVIIGRSPECQITIEDPLVSRQHALIQITSQGARVSDLGSRNGVRINGSLIRGEAQLQHNDRLRLGTQDLVFLVIDENSARLARATGYMLHCRSCGRPFPGETAACPHCGTEAEISESEPAGYDTITGISVEPHSAWTFQLLGEVIERALGAGRAAEAERMMQRAASEVDDRVKLGARLDPKQMARVAVFAMRLAKLRGRPEWAEWALSMHRAQGVLPSSEVLDQLEALDPQFVEVLRPQLSGFFLWWTSSRSDNASEDEMGLSNRFAVLAGQH